MRCTCCGVSPLRMIPLLTEADTPDPNPNTGNGIGFKSLIPQTFHISKHLPHDRSFLLQSLDQSCNVTDQHLNKSIHRQAPKHVMRWSKHSMILIILACSWHFFKTPCLSIKYFLPRAVSKEEQVSLEKLWAVKFQTKTCRSFNRKQTCQERWKRF